MTMQIKHHYVVTVPSSAMPTFCKNDWQRGDIIELPRKTVSYPNRGGWKSMKDYIKHHRKDAKCIEVLPNGLVFDQGTSYGLREIQTVTFEG